MSNTPIIGKALLFSLVLSVGLSTGLTACGSSPLQGQEASQEASLSGGSTVTATDVQELSSTNSQVSSQDSTQEATQGSRVQAESVESVQTEIVTNTGIVLTIPIMIGGLFVVLILGWLIPAPPWFKLIFGGSQ